MGSWNEGVTYELSGVEKTGEDRASCLSCCSKNQDLLVRHGSLAGCEILAVARVLIPKAIYIVTNGVHIRHSHLGLVTSTC